MLLPSDSILGLRIYPLKAAEGTWLVWRYKFWHFSYASVEHQLYAWYGGYSHGQVKLGPHCYGISSWGWRWMGEKIADQDNFRDL